MMLTLLILVPLLAGGLSFLLKGDAAKVLALVSSLITLGIAAYICTGSLNGPLYFSMPWIPQLGTEFSLQADGMSAMLCLLTGIVMPVTIIANWNKEVSNPGAF